MSYIKPTPRDITIAPVAMIANQTGDTCLINIAIMATTKIPYITKAMFILRNDFVGRSLYFFSETKMSIHGLAMEPAVAPLSIKNILYVKSQNLGVVTIKMLCDGLEKL